MIQAQEQACPPPPEADAPSSEERRSLLATVKQAAAYLNTSESYVRQILREYRIPSQRVNTWLRIRWADLESFVENLGE